ncbi:MAG: peptidylprolyl isomerase [Cyclobacteriaceae bacterium]
MYKAIKLKQAVGILTILGVVGVCVFAQAKPKDKYLFKLGDREYYEDEFRYYFFKNNNEIPKDSVKYKVEEYLELYVKFRLKVQESLALGKDQEAGFIEEFEGYKSQLSEPYLTESKITESLIKETYERMKLERSASHILLKVSEDAAPADTLKAFNRLLELKKKIEDGQDFDSLAHKFSEDPSARSNRGNLGYFSAMQMVFPFEEATFNAPVGGMAGPVRTRFGYHLIQVKDERPARGKIQVAHIMIRESPDKTQEDLAYNKIQSVHDKLQAGEDWDELCKIHSEDFNTSKRGGALNWFGTGNIVKEFEEAAFALDSIGSISRPVKTQYGWHIIKLLGRKGLEPFEKVKPQLENTLSRDARSRVSKEKALAAVKNQHGFKLIDDHKAMALARIDSSLLQGTWSFDSTSSDNKRTLFTIGGRNISIGVFWEYVVGRQRNRTQTSLSGYITELYNRFEEKSIFDFEEDHLAETNFEYKMILEEYKSGILLFNLMEEMVWQKAVQDTVGQKLFYGKTRNDYLARESAEVRVFISEKQEVIAQSADFLDKGKKEIDSVFNSIEPLNLQVSDKTVERGEDAMLDQFWSEGIHRHEENGRYYLVYVKQVVPEKVKEFDETRGAVISAYQDELEREWIEQLKKKYPLKLNKGVLKKIISEIEKED